MERFTRILAVVLLGSLAPSAGCSRRYTEGDVWGDPRVPTRQAASLDGGPANRSQDGSDGPAARPDAPGIDAAAGSGPDAPDRGPVDAPVAQPPDAAPAMSLACQKCEERICRHLEVGDLVQQCYVEADPLNPRRLEQGPAPNLLATQACQQVIECVRRTGCAGPAPPEAPDPVRCFCGDAAGADCLAPKRANGACKEVIERASRSDDATAVLTKLLDPIFDTIGETNIPNPAGIALRLIDCHNRFCSTPCFGYNTCVKSEAVAEFGSNPICDTDACRNQGECMPLSACIDALECRASAAGTGDPPDAGLAAKGAP